MSGYTTSQKKIATAQPVHGKKDGKPRKGQSEEAPGLSSTARFNETGWGNEELRAFSPGKPPPNPSHSSYNSIGKPPFFFKTATENVGLNGMVQRATEEKSGALEPGLKGTLENYFGTSLDSVKVGNGPDSKLAADKMGAYAYTLGQTIHLGSAVTKLPEPKKNALMAHEVTHTLQQRGAHQDVQAKSFEKGSKDNHFEAEANLAANDFLLSQKSNNKIKPGFQPSRLNARRVQAADLSTDWGEFKLPIFQPLLYNMDLAPPLEKHGASTNETGLQIEIQFHPGEKVNAKKIGLVQAYKSKTNGVINKEGVRELRQAGKDNGIGLDKDNGIGYNMDVSGQDRNPMYQAAGNVIKEGGSLDAMKDYNDTPKTTFDPVNNADDKKGLLQRYGSLEPQKSESLWGEYYFMEDGKSRSEKKPATLYDVPMMRNFLPNSGQLFETAAYCVEGNPNKEKNFPDQHGLYYGSIEWGWERNSEGVFKAIKPEFVKSSGVPSVNFLTAADLWNKSKTLYGFMLQTEIPKYQKIDGSSASSFSFKNRDNDFTMTSAIIPIPDDIIYTYAGEEYIQVRFGSEIHWAKKSDLLDPLKAYKIPLGDDTIDLALPKFMVPVSGINLTLEDGQSISLSEGTKLHQTADKKWKIASGEHAGKTGTLPETPKLDEQKLGKR